MAKMFYTLQEAASKLGTSEAEVQKLVETGRLQEFRDQDQVMVKVEQVDILASGDDEGHIPLAESGELDAIDLAASGSASAIEMEDAKERTGVSIFDADETEQADPSAVTHVHSAQEFPTDLSSSGSGLMDLTREADDTSLGGDALLEGIYSEETAVEQTVTGDTELFEASPEQEMSSAPAGVVAVEPYDGVWSGVLGGAALAAIVILGATMLVVLGSMVTNSPAAPIVGMVAGNYLAVIGGMGALVVVCILIGMLVGKTAA